MYSTLGEGKCDRDIMSAVIKIQIIGKYLLICLKSSNIIFWASVNQLLKVEHLLKVLKSEFI